MVNIYQLIFLFAITALNQIVDANHRCIWVHGLLKCNKDPSKQVNVEIRAFDRDGFSIFKLLDSDDIMGLTFSDENGAFELDGCGSDMNWFPGIFNDPDPYIKIHHYCNNPNGETIELPEFYTFVPNSYDAGEIVLDNEFNDFYLKPATTKKPFRSFVSYTKTLRPTPYAHDKPKTTIEVEETTTQLTEKSTSDFPTVNLLANNVFSVEDRKTANIK